MLKKIYKYLHKRIAYRLTRVKTLLGACVTTGIYVLPYFPIGEPQKYCAMFVGVCGFLIMVMGDDPKTVFTGATKPTNTLGESE